jgi:Dolichyl-phosphate-mannose-protein mannosyltransferase
MSASTETRQARPIRGMLSRESVQSATALLIYLALISFAGHMLVAGNYGYFRDELYYLADGKHLAFGYVDQPLLIGWLSALTNLLFNDNLVAIHLIPALAGACLIVITGLMARELGGGRFAQVLAALASMFALVFMATGSIYSMDVLDEVFWALGAYIIVRLLTRNQPQLWLLFGLVAGIALTAKLTMLFFGFALTIALLLTPARRYFRTRWLWLGGAIAFAFLVPYGIWNALNGWPTWTFWHHYSGVGNSPIGFLTNQILLLNPIAVPLAVTGLVFYFREEGKPYRVLGWAFVILVAVLALGTFKPYFLPPAYPMLFAPGALVFERFFQRQRWAWLKPTYVGGLVLLGLLLAPLAMPILPPAAFVSHYGFLTGVGNGGAGQPTAGAFPQYLGDRFGWDTMAATVGTVYQRLPADERAHACIFTDNYGEASALNFLGPQYHLPPAISGNNNYFFWGPGSCDGSVLITVGLPLDQVQYTDIHTLHESYARLVQVATNTCQYCMESENDLPIYVCTQPTFSNFSRDVWPRLQHFG